MNFAVPKIFHKITKKTVSNLASILEARGKAATIARLNFNSDHVELEQKFTIKGPEFIALANSKLTRHVRDIINATPTEEESAIEKALRDTADYTLEEINPLNKLATMLKRHKYFGRDSEINSTIIRNALASNFNYLQIPVYEITVKYKIEHSELPESEKQLLQSLASAKGKKRAQLIKLVKRSWLKIE